MNSIHKVGLQIAGFVTVIAVAAMFTAQGYMAARQAQAAQPPAPAVADMFAQPTDPPSPSPTDTPPQIIYIAPPTATPVPPTHQPVVAPPPAVQATPPIIHIVVTAPPGEHEEPGDD